MTDKSNMSTDDDILAIFFRRIKEGYLKKRKGKKEKWIFNTIILVPMSVFPQRHLRDTRESI